MKFRALILIGFIILTSCFSAKGLPVKETDEQYQNPNISIVEEDTIKKTQLDKIESTIHSDSTIVITEKNTTQKMPGLEVSYTLTHKTWNELLQKHVSKEGNVNYIGFKKDHLVLLGYIQILQLSKPNDSSPRNETLAYWINAYNALTVDLILRNYPIKSIKDVDNPWGQRLWKLGDKWYNLNDIEHQILRKMEEPRIHFAIVCASVSCPKLLNQAYTAQNIEEQLSLASKGFINDPSRNNIAQNRLELSKIFEWFGKDFKQNGTLIDFLNQYSEVEISPKAKITYKDYNWELNE